MSDKAGAGPQTVRIWEEQVLIPTYGVGKPDKNPMFLEKRVYQGSSGRVYPYPVIDKIEDHKEPKPYRLAILENEYIRIEIMPELGGRIYRALDKTNQYDFVYYNRVIKPALVALAGPWVSGGIEFNWPQHHRPSTFGPVEYQLQTREDGSAAVIISETDRMYGTRMTAAFTLYPGKAYLEVNAQLYNGTDEPQTFLWWANPAVAVNDHTQSVFPPDVTAVFDHGKRDVSRFPIATGTYYKMDYSAGVDISRYRNIPVPTSYMAYRSDYDFLGGYDHEKEAGMLHVANRHVSPGKKQWTWGNGEFGQAWDRNLTDEDGPYIELMAGVFTDNQPDFTWLQPGEEKTFQQYFMPYKKIGVVKNATVEAALNLEVDRENATATVRAYATSVCEDATVVLKGRNGFYLEQKVRLSPADVYEAEVKLAGGEEPHELWAAVRGADSRVLVSYRPKPPEIAQMPEAARPLEEPAALASNEQLYLAGLHLEQYRHATFQPEDYYLEGLKRDPGDIRINTAYGVLLLRRGLFSRAEEYFRKAIETLTWRNPNPYDSEAYYQLGLALTYQGRREEAFAAFYKATWSAAWQDQAFFSLARISAGKGDLDEALELAERALARNTRHYRARHVKTAVLRRLGRTAEALAAAEETLRLNPADHGAAWERCLALAGAGQEAAAMAAQEQLDRLLGSSPHAYMGLVADYAAAGLYEEAIAVAEQGVSRYASPHEAYPMLYYGLAYCYGESRNPAEAARYRLLARSANPDYCFPNSLFELVALERAAQADAADGRCRYYLGNLLYDKKRHEQAILYWEEAAALMPDFPTVHRNLALAYYNKRRRPDAALRSLELAFAAGPEDARVLYELDQLHKRLGVKPEIRLKRLQGQQALLEKRDDLLLEYVTLLNTLGRHEEALAVLAGRIFHPWEGGEGKVTGQYVLALVELAKHRMAGGQYGEALIQLQAALHYPVNLGEGKLAGAQENNIYYYMGRAHEELGQPEEARACFTKASQGLEEPASAMYYNDQPPDMIFYQGMAWSRLGSEVEAKRRFNKLIDYAETHWFDEVKLDYFAVSLPDFLVFEADLNQQNRIHCRYMRGLGLLGLGRLPEAEAQFGEVLTLDLHHQGALLHLNLCRSGGKGL